MKRAVRCLSDGLHTCPICKTHQDYLGKLAQHVREHHAQDSFTDGQLDGLHQLGLKSCPTCSLYYCATSNTFTRHIQQCQVINSTPTLSRKRRSNSHKTNNTSAAKRSRQQQSLTIDTSTPHSSSSSSAQPNPIPPTSPTSPVYSPVTPVNQDLEPDPPLILASDSAPVSVEVQPNDAPVSVIVPAVDSDAQPSAAPSEFINSVTPVEIANHPKLLRKVPYTNRSLFITTLRRLLGDYVRASLEKDSAAQHKCIVEILMLPGQTMIRRRGGSKGRRRDTAIMHHRLLEKHLPTSALSSSAPSASVLNRPATRSTSQASILNSIARSVALTREGHYRRAVNALSSTTPLVDTAQMDKLLLLQQLHPLPLPLDSILPVLPSDTPLITVDADEGLVKIIRQMINGSAPGPSGWTTEMVGVLTADEDCLTGLAMLIQDITNGTLPDSTKPFLLPSNLIGIDKNSGASVRPIAIGEVFYRIAAYRGQLYVQHVAKDLLQPIQLGVATSGGCEAVVHNLQHVLEQNHQPVAALAIDFKNAFNSVSRKAMLETLYSHPRLQYIWRLVDFAYSTPSNLYVRGPDRSLWPGVFSVQGVRQGDPLSSLLFALTIQPVYDSVVRLHPTIKATAIQDDLTLVGPPDDLLPAYSTVVSLAQQLMLQVQPSKCQMIYFHDQTAPLSAGVHSFLTTNCVPLRQQSAIILGAPIGATIQDIEDLAIITVKDQMQVLQSLLHDAMPIQEAVLLLRISSTHKLDYLLRCVPPAAMETLAAKFDQQLLDTFIKKTDIQSQLSRPGVDPAPIINQITMPVSDAGGFGLSLAQNTMHIAYVSSLAATIESGRSIQAFASYNATDHALPDSSRLHQQLTDSLTIVHQQISSDASSDAYDDDIKDNNIDSNPQSQPVSKLLPTTAGDFITSFNQSLTHSRHYSTYDLQARLTLKANSKTKSASLSAAKEAVLLHKSTETLTTHSRMLAVTAPGASTWISATAFDSATTIPNDAYKLAVRLRLGLAPQDIMPNNCHSCHLYSPQNLSLVEKNEWHHLTCMQGHGGREITIRHNQVVATIDRFAKLAGATVVVEPKHLFSESSKRPDLQIIMNHKQYLVDVTIVHPTAPANLSHSQKLLGQAQAAEKLKCNKYDEISQEQHAIFIPFVIETYGGLGAKAQDFLNELSIFAIDHAVIRSRFDVVNGLRYAIACSVQRGNALIASAGYANALRVSRDCA
jgi:hypothetical protein